MKLIVLLLIASVCEGRRAGFSKRGSHKFTGSCSFNLPCDVRDNSLYASVVFKRPAFVQMDQPFGIVKKELDSRMYMFKNNHRISEGNVDIQFTATHRGSINYDCDIIYYDCDDSIMPTTQTDDDSMRSTTIVSPDESDKHVQNVVAADIDLPVKVPPGSLSSNAPLTMPPALDKSSQKLYGTSKPIDTLSPIISSNNQIPPKPTSKSTRLPTGSSTNIKVPSEGKNEKIKSTKEPIEELDNQNDKDFDSLVDTLKLASTNIATMTSSSSNNSIKPTTKKSLPNKSESVTKAVPPLSTETATKSSPAPKPTDMPPMRHSKTSNMPPVKPLKTSDMPPMKPTKTSDKQLMKSSKTSEKPQVKPSKTSDMPPVKPFKPLDMPPMKPSKTFNMPPVKLLKISDMPPMKPSKTLEKSQRKPSKTSEKPPVKPSETSEMPPVKPFKQSDMPPLKPSKTSEKPPMVPSKTSDMPQMKPSKISEKPPMKPSKTNISIKPTTKLSFTTIPTQKTTNVPTKSSTNIKVPSEAKDEGTKSTEKPIDELNNPIASSQDFDSFVDTIKIASTNIPIVKSSSSNNPTKPTEKMSLPTESESATKAMTPLSTESAKKSSKTPKPTDMPPMKLSKTNTQTTKLSLSNKSESATKAMMPLSTESATKPSQTPKPTDRPPMKHSKTNISIKPTTKISLPAKSESATKAMPLMSTASLMKSSSTEAPTVVDNDLAKRQRHNQSLKKRLLRLLERRYIDL